VNAVLAVGLAPLIGFEAAAWGTTLAGWAMVFLLWRGSRDMGAEARMDARLVRRLGRIAAASAIMGAALLALAHVLAVPLVTPTLRYAALGALVLGGIVVYGLAGLVLGAFRLSDLRGAFARRG